MKLLRYIIYVLSVGVISVALTSCSVEETNKDDGTKRKQQELLRGGSAPIVTTSLSADTIMIGDRVILSVDVEKDVMQNVEFPALNEENGKPKNPSIEVLHDFALDTMARDGRRILLRKRYEMVIYDEGVYNMGKTPVLYADKNIVDTLYAESEEMLVVKYPELPEIEDLADTVSVLPIRNMKPQKDLEFRFEEISGYVGLGLAGLLLVALMVWLLVRYLRKRGRGLVGPFKPTPQIPPHLVALAALAELHNEQLWQNNRHKEYYSSLSDILRTYMEGRFEIGAMEMTTDEIVVALCNVDIDLKSKRDLFAVLREADLVKFAKVVPGAEENEAVFGMAVNFVEDTMPIKKVEKADEPTKNEKEEQ